MAHDSPKSLRRHPPPGRYRSFSRLRPRRRVPDEIDPWRRPRPVLRGAGSKARATCLFLLWRAACADSGHTVEDAALKTVAVLALCLASPALADDEAFPVSGSLSTGVSFNHANFTSLGSQEGAAGTARGSINANVSYSPPVENLSLSAGFGITKPLEENYSRSGQFTQPYKAAISDISLGIGYGLPELGPASFSLGLDFTAVPLSAVSQAQGLLTSISPGLSVSIKIPGGLGFSAGTGLGWNINSDATVQLDCAEFPSLCQQIGGAGGLGIPNTLLSFSANAGLSWSTPLKGLSLRAGYNWGTGLSEVEFKKDAFTSEYAQTGKQLQGDSHGTNFGISYTPKPLIEVPEGEEAPEPEGAWAVLGHFTLSLGMSTNQAFYSADGQRVTVPLFDFETGTQARTSYSVNLSANF